MDEGARDWEGGRTIITKMKKLTHQSSLPFPPAADELHKEGTWLWIPLRKEWRDVTNKPEERVRQKFIRALVEHYGYSLEQMDQERRTQHGHKSPRTDIVVWQLLDDKTANRSPALVVECKTDTIEIQERDYCQGESYTRATGCKFFIATNIRHTAIFKLVPGAPGEFIAINEIPKATDWGDAKRLKEIRESLEQETETIERAGWQAFERALGVVPPPPLPDRPVFLARFRDVERWSHDSILRSLKQQTETESDITMIPLDQLEKVSYGIQKCPANRPGTHARPYLRVANVQRGVLDLREIKHINVPDEEMPKLRLEVGDVLLCEGNSPDLVGRGAIWRGEIEDCVHQNHVLRVRVDRSRLLPEFVLAVINSGRGQGYFRSKAKRTTNLASINSKEVAGLPVPDVSITEQEKLLSGLNSQIAAANSKRTEAATLRKSAWTAFESALFTAGEAAA